MNQQSLDASQKQQQYDTILMRITALLDGETDEIAALATVACELHHGMPGFHWTGFYRVTAPELLTVGPYQGGHGCLRIPFHRGVCGEAARTKRSILVEDVNSKTDHIACSTSTVSELVVPVFNTAGEVVSVLDLDSDFPAHFDEIDQTNAERICALLSRFYS